MVKRVQSKTKDFDLNPIGMGTMGFGGYFSKDLKSNRDQVNLIEEAYDLGVNVIDTAEIYGEGAAEETIGKTCLGVRNNLFIMSKFSPENSSPKDIVRSLESSLIRVKRDYLDVYQPHWPQPGIRLDHTLEALELLQSSGKIRFVGLSNFPLNQVSSIDIGSFPSLRFFQCEFNPIEHAKAEELFPTIEKTNGALIAYSPFREGQIFKDNKFPQFEKFCKDLGFLPSQVLLAWSIFNEHTVAIPKFSTLEHLRDNIKSLNIRLSSSDMTFISDLFKPRVVQIKPKDVVAHIPVKQDERKIYENIDDAMNNIHGFNPGPMEIVNEIKLNDGKLYKPVKVKEKNKDGNFVLIDGRLRFWAWVILYGWDKPIEAVVVDY